MDWTVPPVQASQIVLDPSLVLGQLQLQCALTGRQVVPLRPALLCFFCRAGRIATFALHLALVGTVRRAAEASYCDYHTFIIGISEQWMSREIALVAC